MIEQTISEARQNLSSLPDQLEDGIAITRNGKRIMAVLAWEDYQSLQEDYESMRETLEIMSDPELMDAFRQGVTEAKAGLGMPLDQFKLQLGVA